MLHQFLRDSNDPGSRRFHLDILQSPELLCHSATSQILPAVDEILLNTARDKCNISFAAHMFRHVCSFNFHILLFRRDR